MIRVGDTGALIPILIPGGVRSRRQSTAFLSGFGQEESDGANVASFVLPLAIGGIALFFLVRGISRGSFGQAESYWLGRWPGLGRQPNFFARRGRR